MHGIAHIDGHIEINSLDKFFNDLKNNSLDIAIQLIGSRDQNKIGLNSSDDNVQKVKNYLNKKGFLLSKIIDSLINSRKDMRHFVANEEGQLIPAIATGIDNFGYLDSVQAIKREGRYIGTYSLCKVVDGNDNNIMLDERTLVKLNEYEKKYPVKPSEHDILVEVQHIATTDVRLEAQKYYSDIELVRQDWNSAISNIIQKSNHPTIDAESLRAILKKTPLFIGKDSIDKNEAMIAKIKQSKNIEEVQVLLHPTEKVVSSIKKALEIAKMYDNNLPITQILDSLALKYNDANGTTLTGDELGRKKYGGKLRLKIFVV